MITATAGQKILLRISNLNVTNFYTLTAAGLNMRVIGTGARQMRGPDPDGGGAQLGKNTAFDTMSVTLGGGEAVDVIIDTASVTPGTYFLHTTNAKTTFQKSFDGANLLRTAFGVLTSMLIFQLMQAFTTVFTSASDQARQLEENIWRLANAERALSKEGINISLQGMEDAITRIQQKFKVFSREDITQLYSSVAVATKQLGLSEKEITDLTESVVFLNIQSSKQEDLMTTQSSLLSSLLGKNSTGISQLGVSLQRNIH